MNNNICFIHYRSKDQTSLDGPMDNCLNIPWIVDLNPTDCHEANTCLNIIC